MDNLVVFKQSNGDWLILFEGRESTVADFMQGRITIRQLVEALPGCLSRLESPVEECLAMVAPVSLRPDECEEFRWDEQLGPLFIPQEVRAVSALANLLEMPIRVEFSGNLAISCKPLGDMGVSF